jgi:hypothetical protein
MFNNSFPTNLFANLTTQPLGSKVAKELNQIGKIKENTLYA